MTTLILEVYDAFKSVGVDDEMARKAAGALSNIKTETADLRTDMTERFNEVDRKFDAMDRKLDAMLAAIEKRFDAMALANEKRFGAIEGRLSVHNAIGLIILGGIVSLVAKSFF